MSLCLARPLAMHDPLGKRDCKDVKREGLALRAVPCVDAKNEFLSRSPVHRELRHLQLRESAHELVGRHTP